MASRHATSITRLYSPYPAGGEREVDMPDDAIVSDPFEATDDADDPTLHPLEVDEKDMPIDEARCWLINGSQRPVDVYVNYADSPLATDIKPRSIGNLVPISGKGDRPYGTYTLEFRDAGQPDSDVLATASVDLDEGDSVSAVVHRVGEFDYQASIFVNDYSPSEEARVIVRHCAYPETIDWEFAQNGETPRIPDDPRSGSLERGEWQTATDVTESDYLFEVLVDGEVAAFDPNYEFEVETTYVVYVVGDPEPLHLAEDPPYPEAQDSGIDESQWLLLQAFEVVPGTDEPDQVTAPEQPLSTTDSNAPIEFDCPSIDLYETNEREVEIAATDPDGIVTGLAIADVEPATDGFTIVDNSTDRAVLPGETTTATFRVAPDLPADSYDVTIEANPQSLGASATCTVEVEVEPVPIGRLYDLVDEYQLSGDVARVIATELNVLFDDATAQLDAGKPTQVCATLKQAADLVGSNKGTGVSEPAHNDLQREIGAVRTRLDCG